MRNLPITQFARKGRLRHMSSKWNLKKVGNSDNVEHNKKFFRKTAMTIVLLTSVSFNLAFANNETSSKSIDKIYHIYIGEKYIGAVSDEKLIKKTIEEKESEIKQKYSQYNVDGSSNVKVIPEQVFSYQSSDSQILDKLKEELVIETEAYAVKVNNKVVGFVQNEEEFNKAIRQLMLEYVSEKELKQYEANLQSGTKSTTKGRINVIDISIQENITGAKSKAEPSKILTAKQLIAFLKSGTLEKEVYTVKSGDVLSTIAASHGLKTKELLKLNPDLNENSILKIGQKINVTVEKPLVTVKKVYENVKSESIPYKEVVKQDENLLKGEQKIIQEGVTGKKEVSYKITEVNGKQVQKRVTAEKVISEPKEKIIVVGTKVIPSKGTGTFAWPTNGGYISSKMGERWGRQHKGIDIARPSNYNIKAADNGVVTFAGADGTYGNKVVIDHNNGYQTVYAHLSSIDVSVGQTVSQGSVIGIMGSTGRSTGVHLHFEVYQNGNLLNPLSVLE